MKELLKTVQEAVEEEIKRTKEEYGYKPFNSPHEGYAVLKEEVEEAEEEIQRIKDRLDSVWWQVREDVYPDRAIYLLKNHAELLACEAIQVAAMAQKFMDLEKK